jgi:predicted membrane-bound spermidine synthase
MRSRFALVYSLLFFVSGATGLIYELLWVRVLYQSFGSTIQSVTTVVAAYMGGLGLGAWLFGRRVDRSTRPAALYGWLEIAIGVFGILSPLILGLAHRIYIGTAGALELGGGASVALRFGLAALVLLVPTTLMGGTLPVLTRAFMGDDRGLLKPSLGRLYGLNTLGAVTGTALAGFFLIEFVGVRASLWATAVLNLVIGVAAIALGREQSAADPGRQPGTEPSAPRDSLHVLALVLLALTAFASLLNEIAWTRVLIMLVGGSTYAFTLVLLVFLLGIGIGSVIIGRARSGAARGETAASAAVAQGVTGAGSAALFLFFGFLPTYIIAVFQIPDLGPIARLVLMGLAIGGVVLVPAIGMGMTFPLLADLTARAREARGEDVGAAYALNTVGSILGAVLTGFVFVVALGTQWTLRIGLIINALAALTLAIWVSRGIAEGSAEDQRLRTRVLAAGVLGMIALVAAIAAPGWSTRLIDLGPTIYARQPMDQVARRLFLAHKGMRQIAFREGPNATVSVWDAESGRSLRVNGKVDASDRGDMDTQIMIGLAPVVARPGAKSSFLIGYGSGVTARVLAAAPGMEKVRVVEIEPAVMEMDSLFHGVNDTVLAKPGVQAIVDDARSALQLDDSRYDIIVSEPSNPWVTGIATLYTPEFFRIARSRLADDGVFCQWIQLYQLPLPIVAGIVRNLREVFPNVQIWFGGSVDLVVLASARPIVYDRAWLAQLLGPRGPMREMAREWLSVDEPEQYFGRSLLGDSGVARLIERARFVHKDDRPSLEFVAARWFLDPGPAVRGVFDSLVQIGLREDGLSPFALVRALAVRNTEPMLPGYLADLRKRQPDAVEWQARTAGLLLARGDTAAADSIITKVLARDARRADALLLRGLIATARSDPRAAPSLRAALAAGADTAQTRAALALIAVRESLWVEGGAEAWRSISAARGTIRHPFPSEFLGDALFHVAFNAPPRLADSVLQYAVARRPGSARLRELSVVTALRAGRCEAAAAGIIELREFAIQKADGPALVRECWSRAEATGQVTTAPR